MLQIFSLALLGAATTSHTKFSRLHVTIMTLTNGMTTRKVSKIALKALFHGVGAF